MQPLLGAEPAGASPPLLVFDTHPIQYRSPVFRALCRRVPGTEVFFFNETFDGSRWWFHERNAIPRQEFDLPLRQGFPNTVIGTSGLGMRAAHRAFAGILEERRPQAVAVYGYYLPEHWMLRRLCAAKRIPLLFIGETFTSGGSWARRLVKGPLRSWFFHGVAEFIAIGDRTRDYYRDTGVPPARITPAKYCTDVSFFALPEAKARSEGTAWRRHEGIPADAFVVLFVGRLFERKRPADALAVFRRLESDARLHLAIVGNGRLEAEIERASEGHPRIHVLGFRTQAQVRDAYHGADLLFVPSEYETWGLVVNEAFACGRPAVVTDTCGVAGDLVLPGQTGFTYPVGDVVTAAEMVGRFLSDPTLARRMGDRARQKVTSEYSVDQFAAAFESALRKVSPRATRT